MSKVPKPNEIPLPPTEQPGAHDHLESASIGQLLDWMHGEQVAVDRAVKAAIPALEKFITALVARMKKGGRLFCIGAGTSGRLGVVDASECPPTFGVDPGLVVGLIAGGDGAIREAVEGAEDDAAGAWRDLAGHCPRPEDSVLGIAASGRTPYVVGGLQSAREAGLLTAALVCNPSTPAAAAAEHAIEAITGPEFITGSTRLKAGTATKLLLNMISTVAMVQLGHVSGNKMVDMKPANDKLVARGTRMVAEATGLSNEAAGALLRIHGSVRRAVEAHNPNKRGTHA